MNNYVEFMDLMILMELAANMEVTKLPIFGDNDVIIHYMKGYYKMGNNNFHLMLPQMKKMETFFSNISYLHACIEPHTRVYDLSK